MDTANEFLGWGRPVPLSEAKQRRWAQTGAHADDPVAAPPPPRLEQQEQLVAALERRQRQLEAALRDVPGPLRSPRCVGPAPAGRSLRAFQGLTSLGFWDRNAA